MLRDFSNTFWLGLLPSACADSMISQPSYLDIYYSGIRHYNKAIKALKERLHNVKGSADRMTWEVSLLAACLFTGFEVLIGNELGAYWQVRLCGFYFHDN